MSDWNWGLILDIIVAIYGMYVFASSLNMRRTGELSSMIVSIEEMSADVDKVGFIHAVDMKMIIFGMVAIIYSAINIWNTVTLNLVIINVLSVVIFIGFCLWFVWNIQKVRKLFLNQ